MAIELLVLRHGKSSWAEQHITDWERPLTGRGERDTTRAGEFLVRRSLVPDLIITSDAVRAETTARRAAEAARYSGQVVRSSRLYHARPDAIVDVLRGTAMNATRIMIVGHNPGLEELVAGLTGDQIELATATLVHITLAGDRWQDLELDRTARLIDHWHPDDM